MTELNDHLKLLYARAGQLFDRQTALPVQHDSPETIYAELQRRAVAAGDPRLVLTFPVELPASATPTDIEQWLAASGFTRVQAERLVDKAAEPGSDLDSGSDTDSSDAEAKPKAGARKKAAAPQQVRLLDVVADRLRISNAERVRVMEAIELGLRRGGGRLSVYALQPAGDDGSEPDPLLWKFSTGLHCPESELRYAEPLPSLFSFNSAVGACDSCRGFGRVIGVDWGLVIPNDKLTLRGGAIKPIQTPAYQECQDDLMRHAEAAGIPRDLPWAQLTPEQRHWVLEGSPNWNGKWNQQWYGIRRFFDYLESKAYKMHIRVLLSKYRSYTECPACRGARLKTDSLLWRLGTKAQADAALAPSMRFMPVGVDWSREQLESLPGLCLHDLMHLPIEKLRAFFAALQSDLAGAGFGGTEALAVDGLLAGADGARGLPASSWCEHKSSAGSPLAPSSPGDQSPTDLECANCPAGVAGMGGDDFCSQHEESPMLAAPASASQAQNQHRTGGGFRDQVTARR